MVLDQNDCLKNWISSGGTLSPFNFQVSLNFFVNWPGSHGQPHTGDHTVGYECWQTRFSTFILTTFLLNTPRCSDKILKGGLNLIRRSNFFFLSCVSTSNVSQCVSNVSIRLVFWCFWSLTCEPQKFLDNEAFSRNRGPFIILFSKRFPFIQVLRFPSYSNLGELLSKICFVKISFEKRRPRVISYESGHPGKAFFCSQVKGRLFNILTQGIGACL